MYSCVQSRVYWTWNVVMRTVDTRAVVMEIIFQSKIFCNFCSFDCRSGSRKARIKIFFQGHRCSVFNLQNLHCTAHLLIFPDSNINRYMRKKRAIKPVLLKLRQTPKAFIQVWFNEPMNSPKPDFDLILILFSLVNFRLRLRERMTSQLTFISRCLSIHDSHSHHPKPSPLSGNYFER